MGAIDLTIASDLNPFEVMVRVCERQVTHGGIDLVDRIFIEVRERNFLADLGGWGGVGCYGA